jgi:hypothetical protein
MSDARWPITGHLELAELRGPKGAELSHVPGAVREMQQRSIEELRRQIDDGLELVGMPGEPHIPRADAIEVLARLERSYQ